MSAEVQATLHQRLRRARGERIRVPVHIHDWERGIHMREAFGVDGRRWHCAICGLPYWCKAEPESPTRCINHNGEWPMGDTYCEAHGPIYRWTA